MPKRTNEKTRRFWQIDETKAFLEAYLERKDKFIFPRKRRRSMMKVLQDLEERDVLTQPTTVDMLQFKMKNLLRVYKHYKNNEASAEVESAILPYLHLMNEIFEKKRIIPTKPKISIWGKPAKPLPVGKFGLPRVSSTSLTPAPAASSPLYESEDQYILPESPKSNSPASNASPVTSTSPIRHSLATPRASSMMPSMPVPLKMYLQWKDDQRRKKQNHKMRLLEFIENNKDKRHREREDNKNKRHEERLEQIRNMFLV